MILLKSKHSKH